MAHYRRLRHEDRCQVSALLQLGVSQQEISDQLGRSQSSVSREISRNRAGKVYRYDQAEAKAQVRQCGPVPAS